MVAGMVTWGDTFWKYVRRGMPREEAAYRADVWEKRRGLQMGSVKLADAEGLNNLIGSLKFGCHKTVTRIPDDFEQPQFRGLELLAVQITRPNLELVIKALEHVAQLQGDTK